MSEVNRTNNTNTSGTHTEDPLAELARIVSGDTDVNATQSQPDSLTDTANDDFGLDLESELLRELDGSQAEAKPDILDTSESELALALGVHPEPQTTPISETQSFEDQLLNELDIAGEVPTSEVSPKSSIEKQMQADLQAADAAVASAPAPDISKAEQITDIEQIAESPIEQPIEQIIEQVAEPIIPAASQINPQLPSDVPIEQTVQASSTSKGSESVNKELDDIFAQGFADELTAEKLTPNLTLDAQHNTPQIEDLGEAFVQSISQIEQNAQLNVQEADMGGMSDIANQPSFETQSKADVGSQAQGPFDVPISEPQYDINQQFEAALSQEPMSQEEPLYEQPIQPDLGQPDLGAVIPQHEPAVDETQIQMDSAMDAAFADPGSLGSEDMEHPAETVSDTKKSVGGLKLAFGALGVALLAGLGIVAWGAMNGDSVTNDENVPIISAEQTPTKVKPQDPGGKKIANTDNKVYENVAGNGSVETKQEKLIDSRQALKPLDTISPEQKNISRLQPGTESVNRNSLGGVSPKKVKTFTIKSDGTIVRTPAVQNQLTAAKLETPSQSGALAPSRPTAAPIAQPSVKVATKTPIVKQVVRPSTAKIAAQRPTASAPTSITNTRPVSIPVNRPKPVTQQITASRSNSNGPTNIATLKRSNTPTNVATSSATIPAGTYTVQVSSQRSDAAAKASYENIRKRFFSVIGNRKAIIQKASVQGKGTFFRAKIPMGSKAEATKLCASLKRAGGSCFVSR